MALVPDPVAVRRYRLRRMLVLLVSWVVDALALLLLDRLLDGLRIETALTAFTLVVLLTLLNAVIWPILMRVGARLFTVSLGFLTVVVDGLVLLGVAWFIGGLEVDSLWVGILVVVWLTIVNTLLGAVWALNDDGIYYRLRALDGASIRRGREPGVIFLEIDGLSAPVLRLALASGKLPLLAGWLAQGSHRIVEWETDLSSQTSAGQAGLLHGRNDDIPAFRWYERSQGRTIVSNHVDGAAWIEQQVSDGQGLLAHDGASRCNMFSGDAPEALATLSSIRDQARRQGLTAFLSAPGAFTRMLVLMAGDVLLEKKAAWSQRLGDEQPRIHRGGRYALIRAAMTVVMRDIAIFTVVGDMLRGVPIVYATFIGYDEVAHHSGIARPDALTVLKRLDGEFSRLTRAASHAARPYHVVVLSDHGQSQGATFRQRYGQTLQAVVEDLTSHSLTVAAEDAGTEGLGQVSAALSSAIAGDPSVTTVVLRNVLRSRTHDGVVVLDDRPPRPARFRFRPAAPLPPSFEPRARVMASGNLGLIYFTDWTERLTLEQIEEAFPGLLPGLAAHVGISFVLVRSAEWGPVVLGATGARRLADDHVEGDDPLLGFGENAAAHLRRTDGFSNAADIFVISIVDHETGEVAAFEELVGSHGGLGGWQSRAFLIVPSEWEPEAAPLVGAPAVHQQLRRWLGASDQ